MPSKNNIIDIIIAKTDMKQKDIAEKLGVSRAQISKWKAGEIIPHNRREELNEMAGLFGDNTEWSLLTKTSENAENWINFFREYHQDYLEVNPCNKLSDDPDIYVPSILLLFKEIGIKIPEIAPDANSEFDILKDDDDENEDFDLLIREYLESYAALINWHEVNICLTNDIDVDILDETMLLEYCITEFAITYVDTDLLSRLGADLSKVKEVSTKAKIEIAKIIKNIVNIMINNKAPIMRDYFDILKLSPYELDDDLMESSFPATSMESCLPYFEKMVLRHSEYQTRLLEELHLKIDILLKPEDRERLNKVCVHTPPMRNDLLVQEAEDSFNKEKKPSEDGKADSTEEETEPTE